MPKLEWRNNIFTKTPKYYQIAENQSTKMMVAPKNERYSRIILVLKIKKFNFFTVSTYCILTDLYNPIEFEHNDGILIQIITFLFI